MAIDLIRPPGFLPSGANAGERVPNALKLVARAEDVDRQSRKDRPQLSYDDVVALESEANLHAISPAEVAARHAEAERYGRALKPIFEMQTPYGRITIDASGLNSNAQGISNLFSATWKKAHEDGTLPEPQDRAEAIRQTIALARTLFGGPDSVITTDVGDAELVRLVRAAEDALPAHLKIWRGRDGVGDAGQSGATPSITGDLKGTAGEKPLQQWSGSRGTAALLGDGSVSASGDVAPVLAGLLEPGNALSAKPTDSLNDIIRNRTAVLNNIFSLWQ